MITLHAPSEKREGHIESVQHSRTSAAPHTTDKWGTCTLTYLHIYLHTYILTYLHTYILTYLLTYLHTYLHTYILTYLHTYLLTYLHTYILTYLHTYIFTYIHTFIHSYIHTFIHPYIHSPRLSHAQHGTCTHERDESHDTALAQLSLPSL